MSGISTTSGAGTTVQHPISVQIAQGTGQVSASTGGTLVASGVPVAAAGAGGSCETNLGTGGNTGNGGGTQNGGTVLGLCGGVLGSAVSPHLPLMLHPSLLNGGSLGGTSSSLAGSIGTSLQPSSLSGPIPAGAAAFQQLEKEKIYQLVMDLTQSSKREFALLELSKKRESFPDLAPILWHSFGTIAALLQEIVSIYPLLSPPSLTAPSSNRVCNSLALLQCVASHPDTRQLFLNAHIPLFLYPFLNTVSKSRPFEYLRLTSLGVIGALVKVDDPDVINFLLQTEIIPLCLRIMETGSELSKTVGTFILQKILLDDLGLNYICATAERFYAVSTVLSNMVASLVEFPSPRLLKHIIRCYLRLADNCRAREALRQCLPESLKDKTFHACLKDDNGTKRWLMQLLSSISDHSQIPLVQSNQ